MSRVRRKKNRILILSFLGSLFGLGTVSALAENSIDAPKPPAQGQTPAQPRRKTSKKGDFKVSVKSEDFQQPMYFDAADIVAALEPPQVDYDLTLDKSRTLRIGNILVTDNTFLFALRSIQRFFPKLRGKSLSKELTQPILLLRWPEALFHEGLLEMISREGKVIWKTEISAAKTLEWKAQVDDWGSQLMDRGATPESVKRVLSNIQIGFVNPTEQGIPLENQKYFKFCLSTTLARAQTKICSRRYGTKGLGSNLIMGKMRSDTKPRVFIENEEVGLKGQVKASLDLPTRFFAELASGESYEFVSQARKPQLMEVVSLAENPGFVQVVGYEAPPSQEYVILNAERRSFFVDLFGFQDTIKDSRVFWATEISKDEPHLFFPGSGGGLFRQQLDIQEAPLSELRPYLATATPKGTYLKNPILHGRRVPQVMLKAHSPGGEVSINKKNPSFFDWRFVGEEKGEINRSYLELGKKKPLSRVYFELYRGYGNELSARLSGIASSGQGMIMGEAAYNHWFENIFGWQNYWISQQRWGLSFKYFKSLTDLKLDGNLSSSLQSTTVDLKYRFSPGLWTREESMGIMASYQAVTFDQLVIPMIGAGWFWARSMPRVFDTLFNYLPFMSYPKWVDMEFIYYTGSLDSDLKMDFNYALNFHGQVLWRKWIFGEAGFGVKRYAYSNAKLNQKAELNSFYGTVGLGIKF